jgi:hypothetical protein
MAEILLSANIVVSNGPQFALHRSLTVEAYDRIDVEVPAGTTDKEVELQPGGAGRVQFIAIVADAFAEQDEFSYKINNTGSPARALDQPHILMGKGAVSMFDAAPTKLFFKNSTSGANAKDINVQILLGRDATP